MLTMLLQVTHAMADVMEAERLKNKDKIAVAFDAFLNGDEKKRRGAVDQRRTYRGIDLI